MHRAYKAHIISTIVDLMLPQNVTAAYKAHIISTIVDWLAVGAVANLPIRLI